MRRPRPGRSDAARRPAAPPLRVVFAVFSIASLLCAAVYLPGGPAYAQGSGVRAEYGKWSMVCSQPGGAGSEQCAILQDLQTEAASALSASVIAFRTADKKAEILRFLAPLGVSLLQGIEFAVDGKPVGRIEFVRCFDDGCYAETLLDAALLTALSSGKAASVKLWRSGTESVELPLALEGFAQGFAALPQ